jgi:hypothetical protein
VAVLAVMIILAGIGAPYLRADYFRARIQQGLEQALGRKVTIGDARYNLFRGPGFTVEEVTIEEDERVGIEPFAHAPELHLRVSLLSLFTGKLEFATLRLVEPSINLTRAANQQWNLPLLLDQAPKGQLPPLEIRGGRINFKFGDRKSIFYLGDADCDFSQGADGLIRFTVSGEPYRTDRSAQSVARLVVRGRLQQDKLDAELEIERSSVPDVLRLVDGRDFGLKGFAASTAQLRGSLAAVDFTGQLRLDDLSARLWKPTLRATSVAYRGRLDFAQQALELSSAADVAAPLSFRFRTASWAENPDWSAEVRFAELPAAALMEGGRQLGLALPPGIEVDGKLKGELAYRPGGLGGELELRQGSVRVGDAAPLTARRMQLRLEGKGIDVKVNSAEEAPEAAETPRREFESVEAVYSLDTSVFQAKLTGGGPLASLRPMLGTVPLLSQLEQGTWRGVLRLQRPPGEDAVWTGQGEIRDAVLRVEGIAEPVTLLQAAASWDTGRALVRSFRARAGKVEVTGDYRYEHAAARPHKLNLTANQVDAAELERLLLPTLARGGFLDRALRLGRAPAPAWLTNRKLEGTLKIAVATAGEHQLRDLSAKVVWNGITVKLADASGTWDDASWAGQAELSLSRTAPTYRLEGEVIGMAYRQGTVDFRGQLETRGLGAQLTDGLKSEGTFTAENIRWSAEQTFDSATGKYELLMVNQAPRWKLTALELMQGRESFQGQGGSQPDGRLLLELNSGRRQLRLLSAAQE